MIPWFVLNLMMIWFLGFGLYYFDKIRQSYTFFKKRGIKYPNYEFFYGNYREIKKKTYCNALQDWTTIFGKIYGYYEGHLPVLVISDLQMIQEIFIKQFANFSARKMMPLQPSDDSPALSLLLATKSRWKRMRNTMNPTFSSAKLKEINPLVVLCVDRLVNVLKDKKEINIADFFKRFTMDTICNVAFGIDKDIQNDTKNEYFLKAEDVFKRMVDLNLLSYIGVYFHEIKTHISSLLLSINILTNSRLSGSYGWIFNKIYELVEKRKNEKINRKDYIQLLIDAETNNSDNFENKLINLNNITVEKKLSNEEVRMSLVSFLLAGYETTSNTLTNSTFILAKYPEEQLTILDELCSHFNKETNNELKEIDITYDDINKLEYLDMFIKEVLRMYPIGVLVRRCTNPTTVNGIEFPLNFSIAVDVLSIHNDPELWGPVDTGLFYPMRFAKECNRNPLAFLGFGLGPKNCIGMKFALMELKMALVKLIINFEILPSSKTPEKLQFQEGIIRSSKGGVDVLLKRRLLF